MGTHDDHGNEPLQARRLEEEGRITLVPCPLCAGKALVPPEIAESFDRLAAAAKEHA